MTTPHRRRAASALARAFIFVSASAFAFAFAPPTLAATLRATLAYEVPPGASCPGESVLRGRVIERLGYDPFQSGANLHVAVRVANAGPGLSGRVEWHDDAHSLQGEQAFPTPRRDCAHLVDEMAFALAVQIQLLGTVGEVASPSDELEAPRETTAPASPPADQAKAHASPLPRVPEPEVSSVRRHSSTVWGISVGAGPSVAFGFAPTVTASGRLFAELQYGRGSLQLAGEATAPSSWRRSNGSGFRDHAASGELGICGSIDRFALCGLGSIGRVWVQGFGVDQPGSPSGWVARAGLRVRASQPLGAHLTVALRVDGLVLLTPWAVTLDGAQVWSLPTFASVVGLDATARFP